MTYMLLLNCAIKLVEEIILYYDARSKKHQRTLHVSDRFSVHYQEPSTVYTAIGICHTGFVDCLLGGSEWNTLIPLTSSQDGRVPS